MKAEDVIQAGKKVASTQNEYLHHLPSTLTTVILILLALTAIGFILSSICLKMKRIPLVNPLFYFALITLACSVVASYYAISEATDKASVAAQERLQDWKLEYVQTYLDNLKTDKVSIVSVSPAVLTGVEYEYERYFPFIDTADKLPLSLLFDGGHVRVEKGFFLVKRDVKRKEDMFLEYKYTDKDLGNGIDKGMYNAVVHVTEDTILN